MVNDSERSFYNKLQGASSIILVRAAMRATRRIRFLRLLYEAYGNRADSIAAPSTPNNSTFTRPYGNLLFDWPSTIVCPRVSSRRRFRRCATLMYSCRLLGLCGGESRLPNRFPISGIRDSRQPPTRNATVYLRHRLFGCVAARRP